jgi:hypothetical protein
MSRPIILVGCWPRRMCAELAATYCAFRADVFARERRLGGTRSVTSPRDSVRRNPLKGVHND